MRSILQLRDVAVRYGKAVALSGIDLGLAAGERVALVGANGSGKSTLLRVLHGLIAPSEGSIDRVQGLPCAMLFQRPHMLRTSVRNNVALGLWLRGQRWSDACELALLALQRVGLGDRSQRNARTLSGGQQQRLALARAWAQQPELLLLDEPTASLDPHAKREVEALIAAWSLPPGAGPQTDAAAARHAGSVTNKPEAGNPLTLVFASHNLGQVKRLADRVIYLEEGRVCADLPVREFFDAERMQVSHPQAHLFLQGELA